MNDEPLVSAVVCVFNAGEFLRPSVESLLLQSYGNLEILIINDGSTDGCMQTIRDLSDPRMRIFEQPNLGKPIALNRALDEMKGEYYAIQDADDLSLPNRIGSQVRCMQENRDLAAVYSGHELMLDGRRVAPTFSGKDRAACRADIEKFEMPAHDPTGMYRRSMVNDLRYEPTLRIGQGSDYVLRVGERHAMLVADECLYVYRIHKESVTKRNPELRRKMVDDVLRRACDRRGVRFETMFPERLQTMNGFSHNDNNLAAHFMSSVCDLKKAGRHAEALSTALFCSRLHPADPHYHKALAYALMPQTLVTWTRNRRRLTPVPAH